MPTTSNFGWTTPADTDLVKDGAAAIRTLGNGIDTSLVDLKGGTTGQILSKASNTDLDYTWINNDQGDLTAVSAGVGITVTNGTGPIPTITNSSTDLITTAGDILYGTAADTVARLGIGTAGQVLKVNSGATAPEWGSASPSFVGCSLYLNSQTITANTYTILTFANENFDTDSFHSTVSNTSRITIPSGKGGKYLVICNARIETNAQGGLALYKNGARIGNGFDQGILFYATNTGGNIVYGSTGAVVLDLVATDYLELGITIDAGSNKTCSAGQFGVVFLGA